MSKKPQTHIFLDPAVFGKSENCVPKRSFPRKYPERDRVPHADRLLADIQVVLKESEDRRKRLAGESLPAINGVQMEFSSQPGSPLVIQGLESPRTGVYLLNTKKSKDDQGKTTTTATVLFPQSLPGKPNAYFADKVEEYRDKDTKEGGTPRFDPLVRSIEKISIPTFKSFWFDDKSNVPEVDKKIWCEIWVNRPYEPPKRRLKTNTPKKETSQTESVEDIVERFRSTCRQLGIDCKPEHLKFREQLVFLGNASGKQLENLVNAFDMLSAINSYQEPSTFWLDMQVQEQREWIDDLRSRLVINPNPTCSVCVLDTGVNHEHPLLQGIIPNHYRHSVKMDGNVGDHYGSGAHGTAMCGIIAFGDLNQALEIREPVLVNHAIESVKILDESEDHPPELYGMITARAVSFAEIEAPHLNRVICMAVTEGGFCDGSPSSWSGTVDELAFGETAEDEIKSMNQRLVILSAGNLQSSDDWLNYPTSNDTAGIESPAQSWNALTVGAYTTKCTITEPGTEGYLPVAHSGKLSPYSRTSIPWNPGSPLKPDIVMEGGNIAKSPDRLAYDFESLAMLTTSHDWESRGNFFTHFSGTSLATAQASHLAANIFAAYPGIWPETVRGILVHSARWTDAMIPQNKIKNTAKKDIQKLIQQVGYGVPSLSRAIHTLNNRITMVIQDDRLIPYRRKKSVNQYGQFRLFELPWPKQELLDLGETGAEIRITLSYFISPSPGRKGWDSQYRYPSFTLKFDINNAGEDDTGFLKRLMKNAESDEDRETMISESNDTSSTRWTVGKIRNRGSIHTDFWRTTAAGLADSRYLAVYPGTGWWKERHQFHMENFCARFSLIASLEIFAETKVIGGIETPIDIYSPVINAIQTKTSIGVPVVVENKLS